jgi:hypothetical protein
LTRHGRKIPARAGTTLADLRVYLRHRSEKFIGHDIEAIKARRNALTICRASVANSLLGQAFQVPGRGRLWALAGVDIEERQHLSTRQQRCLVGQGGEEAPIDLVELADVAPVQGARRRSRSPCR